MNNKKIVAFLLCAVMLLAVMPFSAFAAPSYWGYDSYNTTITPGTNEITSYPTTLTKVSATQYKMTCKTDAGTLTATLEEKSWGMFNLGSWTLVDNSGKTHNFLGASTDWEYVYRTQKTAASKYVWSGGNHGNEVLVSLKFYNGETGQEISLSNGGSITVNKLHIIEKSKLLFKDDTDGDGYGYKNKSDSYSDSDVYANATRKYTVTGPQIKLNVDYEYVKDTYHQLSYTCMFPINKGYGIYCDMYNQSGNKIKTANTTSLAVGQFDRPNSATRAVIYGNTNTKYKFDVHVNTIVDSLDSLKNGYKTMYWNMNTGSNKIYFSKYEDGTATKVASGTQFHTECAWKFFYDVNGNGVDDDTATNIVAGKTYEAEIYDKYTANLTDGVAKDTMSYDNNWFAFANNANDPTSDGNAPGRKGTVVFDLGGTFDINEVKINAVQNDASGVGMPDAVNVYLSDDGETWGNATALSVPAISNTTKDVAFSIEGKVDGTASFVKVEFVLGPKMFVFFNEIEIFGEEQLVYEPEAPEPEVEKPNIDYSKLNNIAIEKDYEAETYGNYTANLTDGVKANALAYNNTWFAFANNANDPTSEGNAPGRIGTVVIDLDGSFDISAVKINAAQNDASGISLPAAVKVYLSDDGETWGDATKLYIPALSDTVTNTAFNIEGLVEGSASFVKVEFALGEKMFVFFNEIEVYGEEAEDGGDVSEPETSEPEVSEPEVSEPEVSEPEVSEPEVSEPEVSEPEVSEPADSDNVALNKDYEATVHGNYTASLTDGVAYDKMAYNNNWFAFYNNGDTNQTNAPNKVGTVVIDLDGAFDISKIKINAIQNEGSGIGMPNAIKVYLSDDGTNWGNATELALPDIADTTKDVAFAIEDEVVGTASYVKFEFVLGEKSFVFFNEIEVYGVEAEDDGEVSEPETSEPEVSEPEVSEPEVSEPDVSKPEVSEPEVSEPDVSEPEVSEPDVSEPDVSEPDVSEPEVSEPEVSEPEVSEPEVSEPEVSEPEVSEPEVSDPEVSEPDVSEPGDGDGDTEKGELGDVDFDGDVDAADYILVKRSVLRTYVLTEDQFDVADIDADGDVDTADYVLVKRIVLGTYTVKQDN